MFFTGQDSLNVEDEKDDMPKPDYKPPPEIPTEYPRTGCNKKVYFFCTERKLVPSPSVSANSFPGFVHAKLKCRQMSSNLRTKIQGLELKVLEFV